MNIQTAYRQWLNRPADERFWGLHDMAQAARALREASTETRVPEPLLLVNNEDGEIFVGNNWSVPTHYAFGQIARLAGAPAEYIRQLPAHLAVACLNEGLERRAGAGLNLLTRSGDGVRELRAATSDSYARIWHQEILETLARRINPIEWKTPPCRPCPGETETRVLTPELMHPASRMKLGDIAGRGGAYMSDRDMFLFLVSTSREIGSGLFRGVIVENSEVGAGAVKFSFFLLNSVCGNHIMWDARELGRLKVVHRGDNARYRFNSQLESAAHQYANMVSFEDSYIMRAIQRDLGKDRAECIETTAKVCGIPQATAGHGFDMAERFAVDHGSSTTSAWAMVNGLTRFSQTLNNQGNRVALDRAAGKLMTLN